MTKEHLSALLEETPDPLHAVDVVVEVSPVIAIKAQAKLLNSP